jgi:hypothetical protein
MSDNKGQDKLKSPDNREVEQEEDLYKREPRNPNP